MIKSYFWRKKMILQIQAINNDVETRAPAYFYSNYGKMDVLNLLNKIQISMTKSYLYFFLF